MMTTMKKLLHRSISAGPFLTRHLSTATAAEESTKRWVPLYARLAALPTTGDTVEQTLNEYYREGRAIKKEHLESGVRGLRKRRQYRLALQIMEWMMARNINFSYKDLALHLDLLAKARGVDVAEKYFNNLESHEQNKCTYGALLNCYCQEKMEEKALPLFKKMEELGITSTLAYNNLISLYMKLEQPEKVPGLVEEMGERNFPKQTFTYNALLHSYGCMGNINGMERVYKEIVEDEPDKCDWTTYSNLAIEYTKAGLREKAETTLQILEQRIGSQKRSAYHFLISLYAKIPDLVQVHRIWNLLKSDYPKTINLDYVIILQALEKLDDIDGFNKLYSEWERCVINFDVRVTNTAIRYYLGRDMITEAESVLRKALIEYKGPFFRSWELFIEFYLRKRNMGDALKCLESAIFKVKDNEWKPKPEYVEKLVENFEEERDVNAAEELCKMLKRIGLLDSRVYLALIRTYIAAGKPVDHVREKMENDGIEINSELENLLQSCCQR